jgi:hypothetical protein
MDDRHFFTSSCDEKRGKENVFLSRAHHQPFLLIGEIRKWSDFEGFNSQELSKINSKKNGHISICSFQCVAIKI